MPSKPKSSLVWAREQLVVLRDRLVVLARANPKATKYIAISAATMFIVVCALTGYYYVSFSRMIDARLHGERDRVLPRVFARPLEIRRGDNISQKELLDRLNDLGYAQRPVVGQPGDLSAGRLDDLCCSLESE